MDSLDASTPRTGGGGYFKMQQPFYSIHLSCNKHFNTTINFMNITNPIWICEGFDPVYPERFVHI